MYIGVFAITNFPCGDDFLAQIELLTPNIAVFTFCENSFLVPHFLLFYLRAQVTNQSLCGLG